MKRVYKPRGKTQADRDWINNLVPEFKKKDDDMGGISADHVMQGTKKGSVLAWGKCQGATSKPNAMGRQSNDQQQNRYW